MSFLSRLVSASLDLSTVYHVGSMTRPKLKNYSYEGAGLSVSTEPDAWREIAHSSGATWKLTKANPKFLQFKKTEQKKYIAWALANDWLSAKEKWQVTTIDSETDEKMRMVFDDKAKAEEELEMDEEAKIKKIVGYTLGKKGQKYWSETFNGNPKEDFIEDFAIVWFAEAHGYDGVWWNEKLNVGRLSAPRGVIFDDKLSTWKVSKE